MTRTHAIAGVAVVCMVLLTACATPHAITRTKTTLGQVDMAGLECRSDKQPGSNISRSICATPAACAKDDATGAAQAKAVLDRNRDLEDNRRLYPGMKAD